MNQIYMENEKKKICSSETLITPAFAALKMSENQQLWQWLKKNKNSNVAHLDIENKQFLHRYSIKGVLTLIPSVVLFTLLVFFLFLKINVQVKIVTQKDKWIFCFTIFLCLVYLRKYLRNKDTNLNFTLLIGHLIFLFHFIAFSNIF